MAPCKCGQNGLHGYPFTWPQPDFTSRRGQDRPYQLPVGGLGASGNYTRGVFDDRDPYATPNYAYEADGVDGFGSTDDIGTQVVKGLASALSQKVGAVSYSVNLPLVGTQKLTLAASTVRSTLEVFLLSWKNYFGSVTSAADIAAVVKSRVGTKINLGVTSFDFGPYIDAAAALAYSMVFGGGSGGSTSIIYTATNILPLQSTATIGTKTEAQVSSATILGRKGLTFTSTRTPTTTTTTTPTTTTTTKTSSTPSSTKSSALSTGLKVAGLAGAVLLLVKVLKG